MTKVLRTSRGMWLALAGIALCLPLRVSAAEKPAETLYLQLGQVGLDPARVYRVRGASLTRSSIQISLDDGTIAFTQDVMGRITGAFFEGEGEILLTPPNEVERRSMALFTGMAILEERFSTAYFRFNDDAEAELRPDLRESDNKDEFVNQWSTTAKNLAVIDAMRLMLTFSRMLPVNGGPSDAPGTGEGQRDRYLHVRLQGGKSGVYDVFYDSTATEQIQVGQAKTNDNGETFYDVWTAFAAPQARNAGKADGVGRVPDQKERPSPIAIRHYAITTDVVPPKEIHARAKLDCEVTEGGARTLLFELSRFLQIESLKLDGEQVEFIHNPALAGTELSRHGNDLVAVVMPQPLKAGQKLGLEFAYGGEVLAEAGSGLLYVGARGTWYPNRGMEMANFDLQFSYPPGWTLVATGKRAQFATDSIAKAAGEQTSRWISDRPIPLAGFNLGKYREATTRAGDVEVETYAAAGVERNFPSPHVEVIPPVPSELAKQRPRVILPSRPSPTVTEVTVGESAAKAIQYFAERFGPFPYSHLALTQMPGRESQGWPGLIFLSSFVFLDRQQREQLHYEPHRSLLQESVPVHETAHQWWGDLIMWDSYRDQWYSEGLANYSALMMLQEKNPGGFREIMEEYRRALVQKDEDGMTPMDAGPVTLGTRLLSSRFPSGYEAISYGRGAWLFHMLRTMLKDAADQEKGRKGASQSGVDEPFVRALRKVRQRYEGKAITTAQLLEVFAEELPPSVRYEGKNSLDWFLSGWINGTSLPRLELKGVRFTPKGTNSIVTGTILQKDAPQDLVTSVPVYAAFGKQLVLLGRVFADGEESTFHLTAPTGTHKIVLDPYDTVLTRPK